MSKGIRRQHNFFVLSENKYEIIGVAVRVFLPAVINFSAFGAQPFQVIENGVPVYVQLLSNFFGRTGFLPCYKIMQALYAVKMFE